MLSAVSMAMKSVALQLGLGLGLAWASIAGPLSFEYSKRVDERGQAYLVIESAEALDHVDLVIQGSDGSRHTRQVTIASGGKFRVEWLHGQGAVHYEARLGSEDQATTFRFDVQPASTVSAKNNKGKLLELESGAEDLVVYHKMRYRTPFAINEYKAWVYGIEGQTIAELQSPEGFSRDANESFGFSWDSDDDVFMVKTRAFDGTGYFAQDIRVPWSVDIPHTDVVFHTAKWDIRSEQEPKLDDAFAILVHELDRLEQANRAVNGDIKAKLYIAGYTDTVGSAAKNQLLSEQRARSIAQYFQKRGAWCEIWFAGMGERGLAVQTDDQVDMEANRRASYILSTQPPGGSKLPSAKAWRLLSKARPRSLAQTPPLPSGYFEHERKLQAERKAKRGGSRGGDDSSSGGSSADGGNEESSRVEFDHFDKAGLSGGGEEGSGDESPPAIQNKPGASAKGCAVTAENSGFGGWAAFILFALAGLRRRGRD